MQFHFMRTSNHTPSPCLPTTRLMVSTKFSLLMSTSSRLMWKLNFSIGYKPHALSMGVCWKGSIIASSNGTADKGAITKVLQLDDVLAYIHLCNVLFLDTYHASHELPSACSSLTSSIGTLADSPKSSHNLAHFPPKLKISIDV